MKARRVRTLKRTNHDHRATRKVRSRDGGDSRIRRGRGQIKDFVESEALLWLPDDPHERLIELTSHERDVKEEPLRRDVRSLGALLGVALKEQVRQALFDKVETIRLLAIRHRESHAHQRGERESQELKHRLYNLISGLTAVEAHQLTKAFATYFDLTNLAETNRRKRRRRAARLSFATLPQPGAFRGVLQRLAAAGVECMAALDSLKRIEVSPVFTAHPTEVARHTVLSLQRRISHELERLDWLPLSASAAVKQQSVLTAEITTL